MSESNWTPEDQPKIHETLKKMVAGGLKMSAVVEWCALDVLDADPNLSPEEVDAVLHFIEQEHDAYLGINWDVVRMYITWVHDGQRPCVED